MFIEKRKFKNSRGLALSAIYEGENREAPTVLICHGFASSKDSVSQRDLRKRLVEASLSVFTFDFTGCGDSQGSIDELIPSVGLGDLRSAIVNLGKEKFALYGSSFGGYVALLYAAQNPVLALTLKAPVSDYPKVIKAHNDEDFRGRILKDTVHIDIYKIARNIKYPTLIIHGDDDDVVPFDQSRRLLKNLGSKEKELKVIEGAPHTMRGKSMEEAHREIVKFLKENLLK